MMYVADMHCDTISKIWHSRLRGEPFSLRDADLMVNLEKMRQGGYLLQNFAMFVYLHLPENFDGRDTNEDYIRYAKEGISEYMDPWEQLIQMHEVFLDEMARNADLISPVKNVSDIEENRRQGRMSAVLTVEGAAALAQDPDRIETLYDWGVRMMTLTWNFANGIGYPNTPPAGCEQDFRRYYQFVPQEDNGLTPLGIEVIERMQEKGIIVDVSHLSDAGFYDVARIVDGPFVASHSDARAVAGCGRNLTDEMIRTLGEHGGVAGLNFCPEFVQPAAREQDCRSSLEFLAKHARHMMDVGGIEAVGLGTDFDGITPGHLDIADAAQMPKLAQALEDHGFTGDEIDHILYKNVLRVYKETMH